MRGTIEVTDLHKNYKSKTHKADAEAIMKKDVADALKLDVPTIANIVCQIAEDSGG